MEATRDRSGTPDISHLSAEEEAAHEAFPVGRGIAEEGTGAPPTPPATAGQRQNRTRQSRQIRQGRLAVLPEGSGAGTQPGMAAAPAADRPFRESHLEAQGVSRVGAVERGDLVALSERHAAASAAAATTVTFSGPPSGVGGSLDPALIPGMLRWESLPSDLRDRIATAMRQQGQPAMAHMADVLQGLTDAQDTEAYASAPRGTSPGAAASSADSEFVSVSFAGAAGGVGTAGTSPGWSGSGGGPRQAADSQWGAVPVTARSSAPGSSGSGYSESPAGGPGGSMPQQAQQAAGATAAGKACSWCGACPEAGGKLKKCGGKVRYCSVECQRQAWQAGHASECSRLWQARGN
ncbi:hypothetical protein ABPG75_001958 [Micractinium tetrahymenae]